MRVDSIFKIYKPGKDEVPQSCVLAENAIDDSCMIQNKRLVVHVVSNMYEDPLDSNNSPPVLD